jgi:hypothetical protein
MTLTWNDPKVVLPPDNTDVLADTPEGLQVVSMSWIRCEGPWKPHWTMFKGIRPVWVRRWRAIAPFDVHPNGPPQEVRR